MRSIPIFLPEAKWLDKRTKKGYSMLLSQITQEGNMIGKLFGPRPSREVPDQTKPHGWLIRLLTRQFPDSELHEVALNFLRDGRDESSYTPRFFVFWDDVEEMLFLSLRIPKELVFCDLVAVQQYIDWCTFMIEYNGALRSLTQEECEGIHRRRGHQGICRGRYFAGADAENLMLEWPLISLH